jgi:hypothetical protein
VALMTHAQEVPATQAWDGSGAPLLQNMPARVEAVADDTRLGAISVEVDGTEPQPDATIRGLCLDLVMHNSSPSTPERITLDNAVPAPEFLGVVDLGAPGLLCPPVN